MGTVAMRGQSKLLYEHDQPLASTDPPFCLCRQQRDLTNVNCQMRLQTNGNCNFGRVQVPLPCAGSQHRLATP